MLYLETFTVSFFGHREIDYFSRTEKRAEETIRRLIDEHPYVEFLVGRDGEYDQIVSSAIRRVKRLCGEERCAHVLVLPYRRSPYSSFPNAPHARTSCVSHASKSSSFISLARVLSSRLRASVFHFMNSVSEMLPRFFRA